MEAIMNAVTEEALQKRSQRSTATETTTVATGRV
jgi:hypothetical protein